MKGFPSELEVTMNDVAKLLTNEQNAPAILAEPKPPSEKQLQQDCGYFKAQKILEALLENELITPQEFKSITLLNRKTFSPFLAEIMPKIRC